MSRWSDPARFEVELDPAPAGAPSWIGLGRIREEFRPPSRPGPVDPVAQVHDPRALPAPGFHGRPAGRVGPAVRHRARPVRGAAERRSGSATPFLAPGWTDYSKRILYQTYDVTELLRQGENVLGALIADGWYSGFVGFDAKRAGAALRRRTRAAGPAGAAASPTAPSQWIVTDGQWQARFGAIRHADLLMGECHDLALEPRAGTRPASTRAGWRSGAVPRPGRRGRWSPIRDRPSG